MNTGVATGRVYPAAALARIYWRLPGKVKHTSWGHGKHTNHRLLGLLFWYRREGFVENMGVFSHIFQSVNLIMTPCWKPSLAPHFSQDEVQTPMRGLKPCTVRACPSCNVFSDVLPSRVQVPTSLTASYGLHGRFLSPRHPQATSSLQRPASVFSFVTWYL